jgi:predicted Rossmann fold flavoprotein
MFPESDSSQSVIDCLLREVNKYGVNILMNREVKKLSREKGDPQTNRWSLLLSDGELLWADYVCVAAGGYPKPGMFDWLQETGHTIEAPVPSLFTFNLPGHAITRLMGVSVEKANIKISGMKLEETGPLLITHWGLSGPAVLRLSAWGAREIKIKNYELRISINWVTDYHEESLRKKIQELRIVNASQKVTHKNVFGLPARLWEFLAEQSGIKKEWRWADLPVKEQNQVVKNLCSYACEVKGKTTFKEEFVTAGGIRLSEVDASTMMSKLVPDLFFAGEILDVDGITGGFNFQHAWTSGFVAAGKIAGDSINPVHPS